MNRALGNPAAIVAPAEPTPFDPSSALVIALIEELRQMKVAAREYFQRSEQTKVQIGAKLLSAKERLPHGWWLPFLEQGGFSIAWAQRMMRAYRATYRASGEDTGLRKNDQNNANAPHLNGPGSGVPGVPGAGEYVNPWPELGEEGPVVRGEGDWGMGSWHPGEERDDEDEFDPEPEHDGDGSDDDWDEDGDEDEDFDDDDDGAGEVGAGDEDDDEDDDEDVELSSRPGGSRGADDGGGGLQPPTPTVQTPSATEASVSLEGVPAGGVTGQGVERASRGVGSGGGCGAGSDGGAGTEFSYGVAGGDGTGAVAAIEAAAAPAVVLRARRPLSEVEVEKARGMTEVFVPAFRLEEPPRSGGVPRGGAGRRADVAGQLGLDGLYAEVERRLVALIERVRARGIGGEELKRLAGVLEEVSG